MHRLICEYVIKDNEQLSRETLQHVLSTLHKCAVKELEDAGYSFQNDRCVSFSKTIQPLLPHVVSVFLNDSQSKPMKSHYIRNPTILIELRTHLQHLRASFSVDTAMQNFCGMVGVKL